MPGSYDLCSRTTERAYAHCTAGLGLSVGAKLTQDRHVTLPRFVMLKSCGLIDSFRFLSPGAQRSAPPHTLHIPTHEAPANHSTHRFICQAPQTGRDLNTITDREYILQVTVKNCTLKWKSTFTPHFKRNTLKHSQKPLIRKDHQRTTPKNMLTLHHSCVRTNNEQLRKNAPNIMRIELQQKLR